jgi:hypothetical protein
MKLRPFAALATLVVLPLCMRADDIVLVLDEHDSIAASMPIRITPAN